MSQVWFGRCLAFGIGFLSLSQEIVLVRLYGFVYYSTPKAFSFVLFFFLLGIAVGAHAGKLICASGRNIVGMLGIVLCVAGLFDLTIPYTTAPLLRSGYHYLFAVVIFVCGALKSVAFPIAHHLGTVTVASRIGSSVSKVYFANILGSTSGPLLTGFVLLQHVSTERALVLVGVGTALVGLWCVARSGRVRRLGLVAASPALVGLALMFADPALVRSLVAIEMPDHPVVQVLENRSGIIHVLHFARGGDMTYGGNVYDGRINTDLRIKSNGVDRVYVLSALHPKPRRVLVIGMSSGAWTSILRRMPDVELIDVVEINPGYVDVVSRYPEVRDILDDPRVRIHFDDGRRWLRRHPGESYDVIVMNTTLHWRAYITNLLSVEFLRELNRHLKPGGVAMYNSTGSPDAYKTAQRVFSFVRGYHASVYVANHDFLTDFEVQRERIWRFGLPEAKTFDSVSDADRRVIDAMFDIRQFQTVEDIERNAGRPLEVITDDNLLTEYKYGRRLDLFPWFE